MLDCFMQNKCSSKARCKMQDARCKMQDARCKKSIPGSVEALKANRGEMEALGVDVMMPSTYGSSSVSR